MAKMLAFMDKFTAQTAILSANFLFWPKPYPKTPNLHNFFKINVAFTKDI
jgi:hypothetical protein